MWINEINIYLRILKGTFIPTNLLGSLFILYFFYLDFMYVLKEIII
jgi:hypothetical protein